jgi:5'-nucleotidase
MKKRKSRKSIIGFDADGIVCALHQPWLDWYNKKWNDHLKLENITEWFFHKVTKKECGKQLYDWLKIPTIYEGVKPIPGAIDMINTLRNDGHEVVIVTHPAGGPRTIPDKAAWFEKWMPDFPQDNIIYTLKKDLIKLDFLVDDSPINIENYRKAWPNSQILTIAYPYNKIVEDIVDVRAYGYKNFPLACRQIVNYIRGYTEL